MEKIIEKAKKIAEECKEYLMNHLEDLEFYEASECVVKYKLKIGEENYYISIWIANSEESTEFYDSLPETGLSCVEYTVEARKKLWDKAQKDKSGKGEKRNIKMSQLSNDLYFSFNGVFREIKFVGYNDSDWWTKYKPTEIKEDENITWQIDLDKMIAIYKPRIV